MVIEDSDTIQASSIRFTMERVMPDIAEEPGLASEGPLTIAHAERELILRALQRCGNNQSKAARELGVTRDVLRHRMRRYGLLNVKSLG